MYKWVIVIIAVFCSPSLCFAGGLIVLDEGQSEEIVVDFEVDAVVTGNGEVCRGIPLPPDRRRVVVNALGAGKTDLILRGTNGEQQKYDVEVKSVDVASTADELSEMLQDIDNVTVRRVGRKVVIDGEVLSQANYDMVNRVVQDMPSVINMVTLSPVLREITRSEIERAIAAEGITGVRVKVIKNNYVLTGAVPSAGTSQLAMTIASSFSPNIVNALALDKSSRPDPFTTIELQLNVVEIERSALKDLGVHWNPVSTSSANRTYSKTKGQPSTSSVGLTGTISDLLPKMRRVFQNGKGRSVVEQSIVSKSGENARFFVGIEYPILVPQDGGKYTVEYKDIGVTMMMKPNIRPDGYINSPIEIESSSLAGEAAIGMPIIRSSRLKTEMNLVNQTSVALAGLISRKELHEINDAAPSGASVSLVQLNSVDGEDNDTREVIVFVTPKIINTFKEATRDISHSVEDDFKHQELKALRKAFQEQN